MFKFNQRAQCCDKEDVTIELYVNNKISLVFFPKERDVYKQLMKNKLLVGIIEKEYLEKIKMCMIFLISNKIYRDIENYI